MSKIDPLTIVSSGYHTTATLNGNFTKIEDAFQNTLSRDGSTPNTMEASIDVNGFKILNHPDPVVGADLVTKDYADLNYGNQQDVLDARDETLAARDETLVARDEVVGIVNAVESGIQDFVGDSIQTTFIVTAFPIVDPLSILVVDTTNSLLMDTQDYSITGQDITFVTAPAGAFEVRSIGTSVQQDAFAFSTVQVNGESDVVADELNSSFELVAGNLIDISTNAATRQITIDADVTVPNELNDLNDVTVSSPIADQILRYNGSVFVNTDYTYATIGGDTDDITVGTTNLFVTAAEKAVIANTSNVNTGDQTITLTGDLSGVSTGTGASTTLDATIEPRSVMLSMLDEAPADVLLGRRETGPGDYETIQLDPTTLALTGPNSRTLTAIAGSGDIVGPGNGNSTDEAIMRWDGTTGALAQDSNVRIDDIGNITMDGTTIDVNGTVLSPTGGTAGDLLVQQLDGSFQPQTFNVGDVVGPASSTDFAVARYDGTTGKLLQDSSVTIDNSGNITTAGDLGVEDVSEVGTVLKRNLSTGIIEGGILSINATTTLFDISDGSGIVLDQFTDPDNPTYTEVTWSGLTGLTPAHPLNLVTYVGINSAGTVVQQPTRFSQEQKRDIIQIGLVVTLDTVNVTNVSNQPHSTLGDGYLTDDLIDAIGVINTQGNNFTASGTDLTIDKQAGQEFGNGLNYSINPKSANIRTSVLITDAIFTYNYQDGVGGGVAVPGQTVIDPNQWDDGSGTLQAVPSNRFTNQRIFWFSNLNVVVIQYGQELYNTLADAEAAALSFEWANPSDLGHTGARTVLSVRGGTTDLTDTTRATFTDTGKFGYGVGVGGGGGGATATRQSVYDISTPPQTITNGTNGADTWRRGSAADTDDVIRVQNGAGTDVWAVTGNGDMSGNSLSLSSNLALNGNNIVGGGAAAFTGNITVGGTVDGRDVATDGTKLDGIEAGAEATKLPTGGTAGQVLEKIDGTDYNTQWVDPSAGGTSTPFEDTFTATGGQTNFTLSSTPAVAWVWVNGLAQEPQSYSIVSNEVVLTVGATAGDDVKVLGLANVGITESLTDLLDVDTTGAVDGSTLTYNGTTWVPEARVFDTPFSAGYGADGTEADIAVQEYAHVVVGRSITITDEVGYIETAATGANVIVDVLKNGVSIYSTRPQFNASSNTLTAGTLSTTTLVSGDRLTFAIDQIGSTVAGSGLMFTLKGTLS